MNTVFVSNYSFLGASAGAWNAMVCSYKGNTQSLVKSLFDKINALDWNKGCYVGQELTARMKYRSLLKKSLRLVKIDSGKVRPNDNIFLGDKKIGLITSIIDDKGLAMIKIEDANNAKKNKNYLSTTEGQIIIIN